MLFYYIWVIAHLLLESLPVSSSGHIALLEGVGRKLQDTHILDCAGTCKKIFSDLLHAPFIIIIPLIFFHVWWPIFTQRDRLREYIKKIFFYVIAADVVTGCCYFLFRFIPPVWFPLSLGFFITSVLLFSLLWVSGNGGNGLTLPRALLLGLVQGLALLPGISRFGSTFVVGRWLGLSSRRAFEVSFLFEWPLLCAAVLKAGITLEVRGLSINAYFSWLSIMVMLASSIGAYYILKWVQTLIEKNHLWMFSIYLFTLSLVCISFKC